MVLYIALSRKRVSTSAPLLIVFSLFAGSFVFHVLAYATPSGPGSVWLQSMSIDKLRRLFPPRTQATAAAVPATNDDV